jgi:nitric oxide synthase-interacting protein
MKDLLAQREALARKKQEIEALRKEEEEEKDRVRIQARERVLNGGTASLFGKRKEREEHKDGQCDSFPVYCISYPAQDNEGPASKKRKFEFDADATKKLAQEAEDEAVRQLELEQVSTVLAFLLHSERTYPSRTNLANPSCPHFGYHRSLPTQSRACYPSRT